MRVIAGIVTISDRASAGLYRDLGGPAVRAAAEGREWMVRAEVIVPDDIARIQAAVKKQISQGCNLVLTTGGTGISPRDVTPEAIRGICSRELPGFGEAMRMESMKITPNAILSRNLAAVVSNALVICLPGKPSGAVECLGFVAGAVGHCLEVLGESNPGC